MSVDNQEGLEWFENYRGDTIAWTTHHFSLRAPYAKSWVDVYIPKMAEDLGWNWCFTIEHPAYQEPVDPEEFEEGESREDPFTLTAEFDASLEMLIERPGTPRKVRLRLDSGQLIDLNHLLDPEEWADYRERGGDDWEWQRDISWQSYQGTEPYEFDGKTYPPNAQLVEYEDGTWTVTRVWTPRAVSRALEAWAQERFNRKIRFPYDDQLPDSPMIAAVKEKLEAYKRGELETYTLEEGIKVSGDAFDFLLSLPADQASAITRSLREAQQNTQKSERGRFENWYETLTDEGRAAYLKGELEPPDGIFNP